MACRKQAVGAFFGTLEEFIMKKTTTQLTYSALFLALAFILPFFTGQIPAIGSMLSPMHLPVMLCGFICGGPWGLAVGFIAPILRSLLFTMPPMFPTAIAMSFELAAYGLFCGIFYGILKHKLAKTPALYVSLVGAMLCGRIVWGCAQFLLLAAKGDSFTFAAFMAGAFLNAVPAIVSQLILVPAIVILLEKVLKVDVSV